MIPEVHIREAGLDDIDGMLPLLKELFSLEADLWFSVSDFDEAFHHRLTQSQAMETAEQLKEFKLWWDLLFRILEPVARETRCSGCCT